MPDANQMAKLVIDSQRTGRTAPRRIRRSISRRRTPKVLEQRRISRRPRPHPSRLSRRRRKCPPKRYQPRKFPPGDSASLVSYTVRFPKNNQKARILRSGSINFRIEMTDCIVSRCSPTEKALIYWVPQAARPRIRKIN